MLHSLLIGWRIFLGDRFTTDLSLPCLRKRSFDIFGGRKAQSLRNLGGYSWRPWDGDRLLRPCGGGKSGQHPGQHCPAGPQRIVGQRLSCQQSLTRPCWGCISTDALKPLISCLKHKPHRPNGRPKVPKHGEQCDGVHIRQTKSTDILAALYPLDAAFTLLCSLYHVMAGVPHIDDNEEGRCLIHNMLCHAANRVCLALQEPGIAAR